jgi:hypothetical protein
MKKLLAIPFLLYFQITTFSQSLTDNLSNALDLSRYNKPPDQVFLHLDRNLYHRGDTIRFQAYIRDRKTGITGAASISLYSLLLNQAHMTIDSARFRIVNSAASGWLKIPETVPYGNYSVLAFTSMMMNYDPEFVFTVPIRIDKLKPDNLVPDHIAGKKGPPYYQISSVRTTVDLRFLPEGGTFIYNIPQRVAFNAVTSLGKTLKITGEIKNQRGEKVAELISGEFGPGLVEFTPSRGETYFATLKGEEFSGMKWPLPIPDSSGIAMRVNNIRKEMIDIRLEGKGVENKTYLLAITMNNALILSQDVRLDSLLRLNVKTDELPAGTAYITLYDNELNPVAERLVFVSDNKKMNIGISSSSSEVNPGDETELILKTTDDLGENISSVISVAVVDSASGFCNALPFPDIESTFLYDRDFYNNLPSNIKIHGLHNIDKKTIDLLLMTYGWRKFNIREKPEISPAKEIVDYDYFKIGNLTPEKKLRSYVQVVSVEDHIVHTLPVYKDKEIVIPFDSLNDNVRQLMILENKFNTKNISSAKIVYPENRIFTDKAKLQNNYVNSHEISTSGLISDNPSGIKIPIPNMKEFYSSPDSVININEVTIRPKRIPALPHAYINKYEKLYINSSIRTLTNKDFAAWPSFEYILALFNPYYLDVNNKEVFLSLRSPYPALFVLDDDPIGPSYEKIDEIPTSHIASISILKGTQGFTRYGAAALGGIVFITTKTGLEDDQNKKNDDLMKPVNLFRTEIEYYIPKKEEVDTILRLRHRPTLLWMNEVFIDSDESVKIRYPNNMTKGTIMVIVNGVSFTNNVGSNSYKYKIK